MDNSKVFHGYKYYVEEIDGIEKRPNFFVSFLNIEKDIRYEIFGVLFKVNKAFLQKLKKRERNYTLINISDSIDIEIDSKAYTFIGSEDGLVRFETGLMNGSAVISEDYFNFVQNSYKKLNNNRNLWKDYFIKNYDDDFLLSYENSTYKDPEIQVKKLKRMTAPEN